MAQTTDPWLAQKLRSLQQEQQEAENPLSSDPWLAQKLKDTQGVRDAQASQKRAQEAYDTFMRNAAPAWAYNTSTRSAPGSTGATEQQKEAFRLKSALKKANDALDAAQDDLTALTQTRRIDAMPEEARTALSVYASWQGKRSIGSTPALKSLGAMGENAKAKLLSMGYSQRDIDELSETMIRMQNKANAEASREHFSQFTQENPGAANLLRVPMKAIGGITGTLGTLEATLSSGDSIYRNLDPNLPGYSASDLADTITSTTARMIEGGEDASAVRKGIGKVGSIAYQGVTGAVDNLVRVYTAGGVGSLVLAGMDSFQSTARDVSARGGTVAQALSMGIAAAGVEALTEKFSVEKLLNTPSPQGIRQLLKNAAIQGGVEVSEEEASFLGNLLFDAVIMGDRSELNLRVAELSETMSPEEAKKQALKELAVQAAETAAVSFVSGGLMSGAKGYVEMEAERFAQQYQQAQQEAPQPLQTAAAPTLSDAAILEATVAGEPVGAASTAQEAVSDALNAFLEKGKVSDNLAKRILTTPGAAAALQQATDLSLSDDGQANSDAVKAAIAAFAQNAGLTSAVTRGGGKDPKVSKVYANTYTNASSEDVQAIGKAAKALDPTIDEYTPITERESLQKARIRTTVEDAETVYAQLLDADGWTSHDNDTAFITLGKLLQEGKTEEFTALARKQREQATKGGQLIQSFAKYSDTAVGAAVEATDTLYQMNRRDVARRFGKGDFPAWKKEVTGAITSLANQIDNVPEGDAASMQHIIRALANFRRTTAWAGHTSRLTALAEKIVKELDFQTAKGIAVAQLSRIPNDYRRRSTGEIIKTVRIHNMLSSLVTINRNAVGNMSIGIVDSLSDSTVGSALDYLVSKATGRREVGVDVIQPKAFMAAAGNAAKMAALCAELDIPLDAETKYSSGRTRTYSPKGGVVSRFLSAYEKYLRYGLDVSDKFFEGGTAAAVQSSLQRLGKTANLSDAEIHALAKQTGARRTFKEDRMLGRAAKKTKGALNEIGTKNIGLGDLTIPFPGASSNITHAAIDYSTGGVGGFMEILSLIWDAKAGKEIAVGRQRKAVTDAARGITGVGLVSLFATLAAQGIVTVGEDKDWDKKSLEQAEGFTGAQLNISAAMRAMKGENATAQQGDYLLNLDFLEPFNAQMRLGYLLAQEEGVQALVRSYPKHTATAIAGALEDSPFFSGLTEAADLTSSFVDAAISGEYEGMQDAAGEMASTVSASFIPAWLRQAAYYSDPFYRDSSGNTQADAAANRFFSQIPGTSQSLPKKYSGLGEEQRRYANGDELLGFFNTFILPGTINKAQPSEITEYLEELAAATGDSSIYPEYQAPKSFAVEGKTVFVNGKDMTETYQKTYGDVVSLLYSDLLATDGFKKLPQSRQTEAFLKAKQYAKDAAKAAVYDYSANWMKEMKTPTAASILQELAKKEAVGYGLPDSVAQEAVSAGASQDLLAYVGSLMKGLTPEEGYTHVRTVQKLEAIVDAPNLSDEDEEKWLRYLLDAKGEAKLDKAMDAGISADDYVAAYRIYLDNDSKKNATIAQWQQELGVSYETAEALYRIYDGKK